MNDLILLLAGINLVIIPVLLYLQFKALYTISYWLMLMNKQEDIINAQKRAGLR